MKNSIVFLIAALSFNSLISCMPQDREVVSADKRGQILSQKGGGTDGTVMQLGSYGFSAFALEKQGEVLQLLALSAANSGDTHGGFTLHETTARTDTVRHLNLDADNTSLSYGNFTTTQNAAWDLFMETAAGQINFVGSLKDGSLKSKNALDGKDLKSAQFQESFVSVTVTPLADGSGLHQVSYQSSGTFVFALSGFAETDPYTFTFSFQTDLSNFQADTFKIVNMSARLQIPRPKYAIDFKLASSGDLSFKNDACPRMLGNAMLDPDKEKTKKLVLFTDTNFTVAAAKYTLPNTDCSVRPLVDLSRVLFYKSP